MVSLNPVQILNMGAEEEKSETARMSSFVGAIAIGDLVKSTLGPKGMDKILQSSSNNETVQVTNDGATILKAIGVDNPAAKVLVDISKVQDDEVGDGTTSVVVLACELLKEAESLVSQKLHPQTVIAGWRKAVDEARRALTESAKDHGKDAKKFREDLMNIARTTLSSKILTQHKDYFANLAVDAVLRLKRRCLEEQESRHFFRQIVSAVDHLHRSGIVHRDLKLDNFLLNRNWDVKIVDFGLSALCQRETTLHTQCGSPLYAAPEIFGNRRYGTAVDLWSLGVCLYATVVGRLPFVPDPPTNLPLLHALILKGVVIPNFLSPSLQQLLSGLLEVQESRRLSITDLLHQSWVTCNGNQPIPRFLPIAKAPPPCVDTNVVRYMTTMFRFGESDVIHSVTERKLNASSATYHLLKRHTESQNSIQERTAAVEGDVRATSRDSKATDRSEVLSEGRQNLRPHVLINNRLQNQDADGGVGGNGTGNSHNPSNYKECILYLKEARCGISLSGRSLAKFHKDIGTVDVVAASSKSKDALLHKLPLLSSQRHPLGNSLHGNGGTSGQCYDSMRQYLHPVPSPDVRLNVMGRPVLKRRGIKGESLGSGDRGRSSTDTENNLTVIDRPEAKDLTSNSHYNRVSVNFSSLGIPKAPPVPPNTAQGARFYQDQQISLHRGSSPRSSVSSPRLESSLQDPFNSDTWRNALRHDPRSAAESEAQNGGGPGGVSYVGPLSSPKALTNREENGTAKKHKYFLVRQLGSETIHRRNFREAETLEPLMSKSLAPTKVSNNHDDSSNDDDDNYDDEDDESPRPRSSNGFRAESQFLTPVIRVTITSTAKQ